MDDKADRVPNYQIWHLLPGQDEFTVWQDVNMVLPPGQVRMSYIIYISK